MLATSDELHLLGLLDSSDAVLCSCTCWLYYPALSIVASSLPGLLLESNVHLLLSSSQKKSTIVHSTLRYTNMTHPPEQLLRIISGVLLRL